MKLERLLVRLRQTFLFLGGGLTVIGAIVLGLSLLMNDKPVDLTQVRAKEASCASTGDCGLIEYSVDDRPQSMETSPAKSETPPLPLGDAPSVPTATLEPVITVTASAAISDTLSLTRTDEQLLPVATPAITSPPPISIQVSAGLVAEDSYTSTDQVSPRTDASTGAGKAGVASLPAQTLPPDSSTAESQSEPAPRCPTDSTATFDLIPVQGPPADHPDFAHGDLNLAHRGYEVVPEALQPVFFSGDTDPDAPQLSRLFMPGRTPAMTAAYRVNDWIWDSGQCGGGRVHGCPGPVIAGWDVTMVGLATSPGEALTIPARNAAIYSGDFKALVLYADDRQITLGYTRHDTAAAGYVVHLLGVCVDPNLLALYRAQNDDHGWRISGHLPALRNGQPLGTAQTEELKVAIRDNGSFMDPRSSKDWWRGY